MKIGCLNSVVRVCSVHNGANCLTRVNGEAQRNKLTQVNGLLHFGRDKREARVSKPTTYGRIGVLTRSEAEVWPTYGHTCAIAACAGLPAHAKLALHLLDNIVLIDTLQ